MAVSRDFVAHALDLLSPVGPVQARAMFGGYGLYQRGAMFGLLDDGELYLKVDEVTLPAFLESGCEQWVYQSKKGPMPTTYYRPPDDAMEDPEAMLPWARMAIDAARRALAAKAEKAKAAAARRKRRPAGVAASGSKRRRGAPARRTGGRK